MGEELIDERRREPDFLLVEREMLEAWLEFHRTTLLLKCEELDEETRKARPIPTSRLSLHGLIRHMAEVERNWFGRVLLRDENLGPIWRDALQDEGELEGLDDASWAADLKRWQGECDASRAASGSRALEDTGLRHGRPCSLR